MYFSLRAHVPSSQSQICISMLVLEKGSMEDHELNLADSKIVQGWKIRVSSVGERPLCLASGTATLCYHDRSPTPPR